MRAKKKNKNAAADRLKNVLKVVMRVDPSEETRDREVVTARQIFFKIIKDSNPNWSFSYIGSLIGAGYDHATVRYGKENIENILTHDDNVRVAYEKVLSLYDKGDRVTEYIHREDVFKKLKDLDQTIQNQNYYLAELKRDFANVKERVNMVAENNSEYVPVVEMILKRLPKNKIEKAIPKIRAVINGL